MQEQFAPRVIEQKVHEGVHHRGCRSLVNFFLFQEGGFMKVNGVQVELKERIGLEKFLESNGYALGKVAVELNGKIVPCKDYASVILNDADVLEIVSFVGGG